MPSRRQVLGLSAGLLAGGAGCVASDGDGPTTENPSPGSPTGTPTASPSGRTREVDGTTVSLFDPVVRKAVAWTPIMGSGGVVAAPDSQYVVASVSADETIERDGFALHAGGEWWSPSIPGDRGQATMEVAGHGHGAIGGHVHPDPPWFLSFILPSPLDVDDAEIRFTNGEETAAWQLEDAAISQLTATGPSFALESLDAPESVDQGELMDVALAVGNTSDVDGRFIAAVYWPTERVAADDESHLAETRIAAGETATTSLSIDTEYTTYGDDRVTLSVEGYVSGSTEVRVDGEDSPTGHESPSG